MGEWGYGIVRHGIMNIQSGLLIEKEYPSLEVVYLSQN